MDPLHPLVPIQPPAPTPPTYNRVQRIERDPQGDSGPDWQRKRGQDSDKEQEEEQFEDDYDPDWSDPAAVEPYGPDAAAHEAVDLSTEQALRAELDRKLTAARKWDPRIDGERRSRPREAGEDGEDGGPDPGPHIDISA